MSAELSARITAATAVLADFKRETDAYLDKGARRPDFDGWAWRLQLELQMVLARLADEPAAGPNLALAEASKLAAIRDVLARFDWGTDDRQLALERIDQIAGATRTASGPELSGGAYISPQDLGAVLGALQTAAESTGPDTAATYRALAYRLGDDR